jgi:ribonuclease E
MPVERQPFDTAPLAPVETLTPIEPPAPPPVIAVAPQPAEPPPPPPPPPASLIPTISADAPPDKPKRGWWRR